MIIKVIGLEIQLSQIGSAESILLKGHLPHKSPLSFLRMFSVLDDRQRRMLICPPVSWESVTECVLVRDESSTQQHH